MRLAGGCTRAATGRPALYLKWTHKVFAPGKKQARFPRNSHPCNQYHQDILRRQTSLHLEPEPLFAMLRTMILCAVCAVASSYQLGAVLRSPTAVATRVAVAPIAMAEPSDKAVTLGAAAVGGLLGVQLSGEITTGALFAIIFAYGSTMSGSFGDAVKKVGSVGAKVYAKAEDLDEQYEVVKKTKSALDTTVKVASNINENYGITKKLDEQLKLSEAIDKVSTKVDEVKTSITSKVDELKAKAASD